MKSKESSMSILERIRGNYSQLPGSERSVADYVFENWHRIARMSIQEIGSALQVSEPTVYRFCQHIGFSGFREFKISLAEQSATYQKYFSTEEAETKNELQMLVERLLLSERQTIETAMTLINYTDLETASQMIVFAERICLFGISTSYDICRDLQRKLTRLGLTAFAHNEYHEAAAQLARFTKNDLLICVTQSGNTQETCETAQVAQKQEVPILTLTANPNSRTGQLSKLVLRTYAPEITGNRLGITTRMAQFALTDSLYMSIAHRMGRKVEEMLSSSVVPLMQKRQ